MDKKELIELILSSLDETDEFVPYECTVRAAARVLQKTPNAILPQPYDYQKQYGLKWEADNKSLDVLFLDSWRANVRFIVDDEVKVDQQDVVFGMGVPDFVLDILNENFSPQPVKYSGYKL